MGIDKNKALVWTQVDIYHALVLYRIFLLGSSCPLQGPHGKEDESKQVQGLRIFHTRPK